VGLDEFNHYQTLTLSRMTTAPALPRSLNELVYMFLVKCVIVSKRLREVVVWHSRRGETWRTNCLCNAMIINGAVIRCKQCATVCADYDDPRSITKRHWDCRACLFSNTYTSEEKRSRRRCLQPVVYNCATAMYDCTGCGLSVHECRLCFSWDSEIITCETCAKAQCVACTRASDIEIDEYVQMRIYREFIHDAQAREMYNLHAHCENCNRTKWVDHRARGRHKRIKRYNTNQ
jgi:hypothetical protein